MSEPKHFLLYHVHPDEYRSRRHFVTCGECKYRSNLYWALGDARRAGFAHCRVKNA